MSGRVQGHKYFEACVHARPREDVCGSDAIERAHPLCPIVSMHPRYACDFLKPASPLKVR
jgi:hypothetical protein